MNKLYLSAFADEYADDFTAQCSALKTFGFNSIEVRGVNGKNVSTLSLEEIENVKAVVDSYGLTVSSIGSPIGKIKLDGDLCGHFEMAERVFKYANVLGAKNVRIFSFYLADGETRESSKQKVIECLEKLLKLAESYGVTLCHENEALIYGESPESCLELLEYFGGKLKCVLDMGNFVLDGYNPYDAYLKLYDYIEYFHIKDALYEGAIVPAGKGEAQIKEILDDYRAKNSSVTITLEPHLQTFSGLNALVGKSFDNPYKYENQQLAFEDAVKCLKELL
ncbi:MAG: sugar phosphate isomerase/epimerase [Clostridia bacterium]|nr:sugar phosphate isomerase/epimerase [Clostridia bacterium]